MLLTKRSDYFICAADFRDGFGMSFPHTRRVCMLYKLVLRIHRGLPSELRVLGDLYARDEFKRHMKCKPEEANIFINEWTDYAINLAKQVKPLLQVKNKPIGKPLKPESLDHMKDEQLVQLYLLHKAANNDEEPDLLAKEDSKT